MHRSGVITSHYQILTKKSYAQPPARRQKPTIIDLKIHSRRDQGTRLGFFY